MGRSCLVLEKQYVGGQESFTLFFVYRDRAHIRAVLEELYFRHSAADVLREFHHDGETADLWVIEHGRRTGHVDLRPVIDTLLADRPIEWSPDEQQVEALLAAQSTVDDEGQPRVRWAAQTPEPAGPPVTEADWAEFTARVPATLAGTPLAPGEDLDLLACDADFAHTDSDLPAIYPAEALHYGMQVWVDGELSDQPAYELTDPDPHP